MNWIFVIVILFLIYSLRLANKREKHQKMLKVHYLRMVLLSTRNRDEFYKLLLRKYRVDSLMYDRLPVKEFNNLWIAISDDAEAWTIGSNFILEKEKVVAPDISEDITNKIINNEKHKEFISWAKMVHGWDIKEDSIEKIKKAVDYREHDSFGNAISEEKTIASKKRSQDTPK